MGPDIATIGTKISFINLYPSVPPIWGAISSVSHSEENEPSKLRCVAFQDQNVNETVGDLRCIYR